MPQARYTLVSFAFIEERRGPRRLIAAVTRSDMTAGVREKYDRLIADGLLVQARWGEPEDVGRAVAMLARGDLPYSTGQTIMVDGGLTLHRL